MPNKLAIIEEDVLIEIAEAIRTRTKLSDSIRPINYANNIYSISSIIDNTCTLKFTTGNTYSYLPTRISYTVVNSDGEPEAQYFIRSSTTDTSITLNNVLCNSPITIYWDNLSTTTLSTGIEALYTGRSSFHIYSCNTPGIEVTLDNTYVSTGCFPASVEVLISITGETKPISQLKTGDTIISYDLDNNSPYLAYIKNIRTNYLATNMAEIKFDNGIILTMNEDHPLLCRDGFKSITQYNGCAELKVGDIVVSFKEDTKIEEINRYSIDEPITVYNLNVQDFNEDVDNDTKDNYYVNNIVVKNKGPEK